MDSLIRSEMYFFYLLYLCFCHTAYNRPVNLTIPTHTVSVIRLYLLRFWVILPYLLGSKYTTMNVYAHATREAKRESAKLLDKVVGMN